MTVGDAKLLMDKGTTEMDDPIPNVTTSEPAAAVSPVLDADNLIQVFTHFLSFDVADGAASAETIIAYSPGVAPPAACFAPSSSCAASTPGGRI